MYNGVCLETLLSYEHFEFPHTHSEYFTKYLAKLINLILCALYEEYQQTMLT